MSIKNANFRGSTVLVVASLILCILVLLILFVGRPLFNANTDVSTYIAWAHDFLFNIAPDYIFVLGVVIIAFRQVNDGHPGLAAATVSVGALWSFYFSSLTSWLNGLGVDSLSEAQNFDWQEAAFFLKTLADILVPYPPSGRLIVYFASGVISVYLIAQFRKFFVISDRAFGRMNYALGLLLMVAAVGLVATNTMRSYVSNTALYQEASANFRRQVLPVTFSNHLKLIVYIGESTSAMSLGLNGYLRDTTPMLTRLIADNKVLAFKNVFSTFTLTSQSLLEGLSLQVASGEETLPITARHRISLIDILVDNNIATFLVSNQGGFGVSNMASSIIFKESVNQYSIETAGIGVLDYNLDRPYDHLFFKGHLDSLLPRLSDKQSAAVFLHSYAGHGTDDGYLKPIPSNFKAPVDHFFDSRDARQITGGHPSQARLIDEYDSAVRYVDFSVAQVIDRISTLDAPYVLIYFSDHGESPYSGRAHDPSRFVHEMARVPFLIYFNDMARNRFGVLFEKYRHLSQSKAISTLAQLPATIIDIFGGEGVSNLLKLPPVVGEAWSGAIPPILVRRTSSRDTYVNLNNMDFIGEGVANARPVANVTDDATRIFVASRTRLLQGTKLCYDKVSTIASGLRGAFVADCLGVSVMLNSDKVPGSAEPLTTEGLELGILLDIARRQDIGLWIDLPAIEIGEACKELSQAFEEFGIPGQKILVTFPESVKIDDPIFRGCATTLKRQGILRSLGLSNDGLSSCDQVQLKQVGELAQKRCQDFQGFMKSAVESDLVSDLSFDHRALEAVRRVPLATRFHWNAFNVDADFLSQIAHDTFRMVKVNARDVNEP